MTLWSSSGTRFGSRHGWQILHSSSSWRVAIAASVVVRVGRISSALLAYVARLQRLSLVWGWVELRLIRRFVTMLKTRYLSELQGSSHALKLILYKSLDKINCWLVNNAQVWSIRLPLHRCGPCGQSFNFKLSTSGDDSKFSSQCIGGSSVWHGRVNFRYKYCEAHSLTMCYSISCV
jgi:hypothetical protein